MRHVGYVGKVVGQHKLSAVAEVDGIGAMLEADVADKANDAAGEGAYTGTKNDNEK